MIYSIREILLGTSEQQHKRSDFIDCHAYIDCGQRSGKLNRLQAIPVAGGGLDFLIAACRSASYSLTPPMSRLQVTFDTLTRTPNDSAVDLLIIALENSKPDIRSRA